MSEGSGGQTGQGVFDGLLGGWTFEREISGRGRMSGMASFTLVAEGVALYREEGELRLDDGHTLHSSQSYLYEKTDGGFAVLFHKTRELFHVVKFGVNADSELRATANHRCKDDCYVSNYLIRADGTFEVRHQVRGPQKDYFIGTMYRRPAFVLSRGA